MVDEFWLPLSNARADLVMLNERMEGFEIKTDRDTLRRLPHQAAAYGRVFDRCTAVVAEKHLARTVELLPDWWGITTIAFERSIRFRPRRTAEPSPELDAETLVRLLWRDEALAALANLGIEPAAKAPRGSLWRELLRVLEPLQLSEVVRRALLARDPMNARIPTRRFRPDAPAVADR